MTNKEFEKFEKTMQILVKVPHSEIKAKLDAEKAAKAQKRKKESSRGKRNQNTDRTV
jgi:hypothetical protein